MLKKYWNIGAAIGLSHALSTYQLSQKYELEIVDYGFFRMHFPD